MSDVWQKNYDEATQYSERGSFDIFSKGRSVLFNLGDRINKDNGDRVPSHGWSKV